MVTQVQTHMLKKLPTVRGEFPLIGSLPALAHDRLALYRRWAERYDEACNFHIGPTVVTLFFKAEHVQEILIKHGSDFSKGRLMHKGMQGNGIFLSEGDFHRKQRKLMAPAFHPRHIVSYAETMTHYCEQLQQRWKDGDVIDLDKEMIAVTMSITGKTLFDADVFDETDTLSQDLATALEYTTTILTSPLRPPISWPTPYNRRIRQAGQRTAGRLLQMINERRRADKIERNDFLSILLNARDDDGQPMSDVQLMDECLTLFGAGYESSSATMSWAWYLLCQHPDIYQKVQEEVDRVLQGRTPSYADLEQLPYCLQVLKETLRIYPPITSWMREALQDLEIAGYAVPKGRTILIASYVLHHRSDYFPHPERFDPERFTREREKQLPHYAYIPFGAGPRICIGNYYALMETHLLLATLAQRVTFALLPGQKIGFDMNKTFSLRPSGKIQAIVHRR